MCFGSAGVAACCSLGGASTTAVGSGFADSSLAHLLVSSSAPPPFSTSIMRHLAATLVAFDIKCQMDAVAGPDIDPAHSR